MSMVEETAVQVFSEGIYTEAFRIASRRRIVDCG